MFNSQVDIYDTLTTRATRYKILLSCSAGENWRGTNLDSVHILNLLEFSTGDPKTDSIFISDTFGDFTTGRIKFFHVRRTYLQSNYY